MKNNSSSETNQFVYKQLTPEQQRQRQRKLRSIGLILGSMVLAILLLVTGVISYSIGYDKGKNTDRSTNKVTNNTTASNTDETASLSSDASKYQSAELVGQGQIPDHYRGKKDSQTIAVEFADYTCPYCVKLAKKLSSIYQKYGSNVLFIYRHYAVGHTYSSVTAKIAEAVYVIGGEDAYWKVTDKLFDDEVWANSGYMDSNQMNDKIRSYGKDLGLDGQAVLDAYNNSANNGIDNKIERDRKFAEDSGVTGTPSWYINGKSITGTVDSITNKLTEVTK